LIVIEILIDRDRSHYWFGWVVLINRDWNLDWSWLKFWLVRICCLDWKGLKSWLIRIRSQNWSGLNPWLIRICSHDWSGLKFWLIEIEAIIDSDLIIISSFFSFFLDISSMDRDRIIFIKNQDYLKFTSIKRKINKQI